MSRLKTPFKNYDDDDDPNEDPNNNSRKRKTKHEEEEDNPNLNYSTNNPPIKKVKSAMEKDEEMVDKALETTEQKIAKWKRKLIAVKKEIEKNHLEYDTVLNPNKFKNQWNDYGIYQQHSGRGVHQQTNADLVGEAENDRAFWEISTLRDQNIQDEKRLIQKKYKLINKLMKNGVYYL